MKHCDMILFMGQSNMQGQTEKLTDHNEPVEGALEYRFLTDSLISLQNPVGETVTYDGKEGTKRSKNYKPTVEEHKEWLKETAIAASVFGYTNMVPSFCRAYVAESGRFVIAVHVAKGSTVVAEWLPDGGGYAILRKKVLAALEKAKADGFVVDAVYAAWLQGESDAVSSTSKEDYMARLTTIKDQLKADFNLSRFGIIKVGAFANDERDEVIFDAQETLCREDADFVMLTRIANEICGDPKYMNPLARGHYNSDAQELIGATAGRHAPTFFEKKVGKENF